MSAMDSSARPTPVGVSAHQSRAVAEAAREREWAHPSFMRELFAGKLCLDYIHPYPDEDPAETARAKPFLERLSQLLSSVDADRIDREGKIPPVIVTELKAMGAFGIMIPQEYGGLGLSLRTYVKAIGMVTSVDAALTALLSAHQSIGVPKPLMMFGTEAQKNKYLPRLARGAISAFALTEADAGSDPARITSHADLAEDGENYILNGEKLWITNGTVAELMVVMAYTGPHRITAFIVETGWPGVEVVQRCEFMGIKGMENGLIRFTDVRVPKENILWKEGAGLKLALITLNTGRLALPASAAFSAKRTIALMRDWANSREQWGKPIGRHDAVAQMLGRMGALTFALESVADLSAALADKGEADIRIEAAAAKLYNTEWYWQIIDDALQIRGGRGYETADSLRRRGERPIGIERMLRDARILRIFEGSSEILKLFIAREVLDIHLTVASDLVDPKVPAAKKLMALLHSLGFYAVWYPGRWLGWGRWPRYSEFGSLAKELRFINRAARRLARTLFHAMLRFGAGLERRQVVLGRLVDIGAELYAMAATCVHARAMQQHDPANRRPIDMAALFCRHSRRRIKAMFSSVFDNDDVATYRLAQEILKGEHEWLEQDLP